MSAYETGDPTVQRSVTKRMGRPKKQLTIELRARREVANSNERRRMQSINNGFYCLRQIMRSQSIHEKQSKAAVLHSSANYIRKLENDIKLMKDQNIILKSYINCQHNQLIDGQHLQTNGTLEENQLNVHQLKDNKDNNERHREVLQLKSLILKQLQSYKKSGTTLISGVQSSHTDSHGSQNWTDSQLNTHLPLANIQSTRPSITLPERPPMVQHRSYYMSDRMQTNDHNLKQYSMKQQMDFNNNNILDMSSQSCGDWAQPLNMSLKRRQKPTMR